MTAATYTPSVIPDIFSRESIFLLFFLLPLCG